MDGEDSTEQGIQMEEEPSNKKNSEEDTEKWRRVEVLNEDQEDQDQPKKKENQRPKIYNFFRWECCDVQGLCKFIILYIFGVM